MRYGILVTSHLLLICNILNLNAQSLDSSTIADIAFKKVYGECPQGNEFKITMFIYNSLLKQYNIQLKPYYKDIPIERAISKINILENGQISSSSIACGGDLSSVKIEYDSIIAIDSIEQILLTDTLNRVGLIEYYLNAYNGKVYSTLCLIYCELPPYDCCPIFTGNKIKLFREKPYLIFYESQLLYSSTLDISPENSLNRIELHKNKCNPQVWQSNGNIFLKNIPNNSKIALYNLDGKKTLINNGVLSNQIINISNLRSNIFLIEINTNNKRTVKIIFP
jgi:hypothetical protein